MSAGQLLLSTLLQQFAHATPPPPVTELPVIPTLPGVLHVPPERTGQIVAAGMAILLDLAGLAAVGIASITQRRRRR